MRIQNSVNLYWPPAPIVNVPAPKNNISKMAVVRPRKVRIYQKRKNRINSNIGYVNHKKRKNEDRRNCSLTLRQSESLKLAPDVAIKAA